MTEVKKGFAPPPEVSAYFDRKGLKPAFSHLDVWATEHAHAFTVAKATELSLLTTFRDSISKAIKDGKGFETWREDIRAELAGQGWAGPRMVADPAGVDPDRMVDFSRSNRLRTIFWGNMSSARAAGQWERAQRTKAAMPFLLYVRTTAADPRTEHLSWVGVILPVDDPFWATHFPPNGWLCHCSVRQVSRREKETLIATKRSDGVYYTDTAPPVVMRDWRNRRTGEISRIPEGIDPGWHGNPGRDRTKSLLDNLELRLGDAPELVSTKALTDLWSDPFVKIAPQLPDGAWLPAGVSPRLAAVLDAKTPVVSIPASTTTVKIDAHQDHLSWDNFALLPRVLSEGSILDEVRGKAIRSVWAEIDGKIWKAVVVRSANGLMRIRTFHRTNRGEIDRLLRREK